MPHQPVPTSTIASGLKEVICDAGIDTNILKAHSVTVVSTSAAAMLGNSKNKILEAADWSTSPPFSGSNTIQPTVVTFVKLCCQLQTTP